jgi:hypothetical protein
MDPNLDPKTGPQNLKFGPRNGPQKWTPKMESQKKQKMDRKNEPQNWTPKMDPKNGFQK